MGFPLLALIFGTQKARSNDSRRHSEARRSEEGELGAKKAASAMDQCVEKPEEEKG